MKRIGYLTLILVVVGVQTGWGWHEGDGHWHTFNMERVGWNGEVAELPGGLAELQVQGDYAYLGSFVSEEGLLIVDISDPRNPVLVGRFPVSDARVLDVKVNASGTIAVLSNEPNTLDLSMDPNQFLNGITIVDIADKTNPRLLSRVTITNENGEVDGIHNLALHGDVVFLAPDEPEVAETPLGMIILDIADPANPKELARVAAPTPESLGFEDTLETPSIHLHDITIHEAPDGQVYATLSFWDAGVLIYDVTDPSTPLLVSEWRELTPSFLNVHSALISPDGQLLVVESEFANGFTGFLSFIDISDIRNPQLITTWARPGPQWLPPNFPIPLIWTYHNFSFSPDSKTLYLGLYSAGVWVLNIENPVNPQVIGTYGPESMELVLRGLGGYPATPFVWTAEVQDGLIYVSDLNSGLYILRLIEENPWLPQAISGIGGKADGLPSQFPPLLQAGGALFLLAPGVVVLLLFGRKRWQHVRKGF